MLILMVLMMRFCIGIGGRGTGCIWVDWDAQRCQLHTVGCTMHTRLPSHTHTGTLGCTIARSSVQ